MDTIRSQMMEAVSLLKDEKYRRSLMNEIESERERRNRLSLQASELDKEVYTRLRPLNFSPNYLYYILLIRFRL